LTSIGIAIPTFREASNIAALIGELQSYFPDARIVVVDDSPDLETAHAVEPLCGAGVELIHRDRKEGRGSAVLVAIRRCLENGCTAIVEMDADFSHAPAELPGLLDALESNGADAIIASRYIPGGRIRNWPLGRRVFSIIANVLARTLLGVPVRDYTAGYRVYSRRAAETIDATCGKLARGFIPLSESLVNLYYRGFRIMEVPSVFINRTRGESSVSLVEVGHAVIGLVRIYGLKRTLSRRRT
jgi:dolichol-phosphate mannosyltransferase